MGMGVLFWLNWRLTAITLLVLGAFGGGMAYAFRTLRPLFRERGKINAEVTGRLTESLGGIRVVKSYTAEKREAIVFAQRSAPAVPEHREVDDGRLGDHRGQHRGRRNHRRADDLARRARDPRR